MKVPSGKVMVFAVVPHCAPEHVGYRVFADRDEAVWCLLKGVRLQCRSVSDVLTPDNADLYCCGSFRSYASLFRVVKAAEACRGEWEPLVVKQGCDDPQCVFHGARRLSFEELSRMSDAELDALWAERDAATLQ